MNANRTKAIKDGFLIDITPSAKLIGIEYSVMVTKSVFTNCIKWTEDDNKKESRVYQNEDDRLWNILFALKWMLNKPDPAKVIFFDVYVLPDDGFSYVALPTKLKVVISADRSSNHFITIMLQSEEIDY